MHPSRPFPPPSETSTLSRRSLPPGDGQQSGSSSPPHGRSPGLNLSASTLLRTPWEQQGINPDQELGNTSEQGSRQTTVTNTNPENLSPGHQQLRGPELLTRHLQDQCPPPSGGHAGRPVHALLRGLSSVGEASSKHTCAGAFRTPDAPSRTPAATSRPRDWGQRKEVTRTHPDAGPPLGQPLGSHRVAPPQTEGRKRSVWARERFHRYLSWKGISQGPVTKEMPTESPGEGKEPLSGLYHATRCRDCESVYPQRIFIKFFLKTLPTPGMY